MMGKNSHAYRKLKKYMVLLCNMEQSRLQNKKDNQGQRGTFQNDKGVDSSGRLNNPKTRMHLKVKLKTDEAKLTNLNGEKTSPFLRFPFSAHCFNHTL